MITPRGKRSLGAVYTPSALIDFMVSLAAPPVGACWQVLEPACADGPFLQAFRAKHGARHELTGVEIDSLIPPSSGVRGPSLIPADYLLWEPQTQFDLIIGNPPYGIIGDQSKYPIHGLLDAKAEYRRKFQTWHGKYNVYGTFVEQSVNLLADGGQLVFVIPSTWMLLDDFAPLRRFLAERGRLDVYYVGKAFAGVSVVAVVLHFTKGNGIGELALHEQGGAQVYQIGAYDGDLICFRDAETDAFERQAQTPLGELFHIRFAARSPEFHRSSFVHEIRESGREAVLTGRNLKPGCIDYDTNYSGLWIKSEDAPRLRSFYGTPHLVVAHTKGARVVAAYDRRCAAWREEFHLLPKVVVDEQAVADYLNSEPMQKYVKALYRDLTPHLTRTQLRRLPMPRIKET